MIDMRTYDWNEVWKGQMNASFQNRTDTEPDIDCSCYWDSREGAENYLKNYGINPEDSSGRIGMIHELSLKPDMKVLEIGPGPGVLTIPIAKAVTQVTAVEPARGMYQVLEERLQKEALSNVTLIHSRWEEVTPAQLDEYDLVVASLSLGMPDIRTALQKMTDACNGDVVIFWHADIPQFEELYTLVWPSLFKRPYILGPKSDLLFQILYQMGIYPSVKYAEYFQEQTFANREELAEYFRYQHYLDYNEANPAFRPYIQKYISEKDGAFTHHERLPCMIFRWHGSKNLHYSSARGAKM